MKEDPEIEATLVDGSAEMLKNAKKNLESHPNFIFIEKTFQELLEDELEGNDIIGEGFDFVVSSLAIHHLHTEEKKSLFSYIHGHLNSGGFFLNIEIVKASTDELERWYRVLWSEWIGENQVKLKVKQSFEYLPEQYKDNPDNHPDTLKVQLEALEAVASARWIVIINTAYFPSMGGRNKGKNKIIGK